MSANTETTGADRAKCKAWCGHLGDRAAIMDREMFLGAKGVFASPQAESGDNTERWCSPGCRDARLPPIAAPEPAKCLDECNDCSVCAPPAQEAPKATPLLFSFTDDEGRDYWFATGRERDTASRAYGAWMKAQTGKPYAGPERLPKPRLAADWVEDCLPESGR